MLQNYRTVYQGGEGQITEKKSRFIATVMPVDTEEAAIAFVEEMKKKYWDASHNCSAYVIGERNEIKRYSDDGEPSQTAGKPMLDVLLKEDIKNTAVVVTRYFGGTLLGTGGLIRAYSAAAKEGLLSSVIITKIAAVKLQIRISYTDLGKLQHMLSEQGITIVRSEYGQDVELEAVIPKDEYESIISGITELTNGKASLQQGKNCWYAEIEGNIKVLEE